MSKANAKFASQKAIFFFCLLFLVLLQIAFVHNKFLTWGEIFDGKMITNFDYGLHYYDALKGSEFLSKTGSFQGFDDNFFGGYEKGIYDDLSSKLLILFVSVFSFLGTLTAYKLFIYLVLLIMPFLFALSLKVWKNDNKVIFLGLVVAILYQNTFKMGNFLWVGMITFPLAVYLSMLSVAFLKNFFDIERGRKIHLLAFTLLALLSFYAHILAVLLIGLPAVLMYFFYLKQLSFNKHVAFATSIISIFIFSLPWLFTLLYHWPSIQSNQLSTAFFQVPVLGQSFRDLLLLWHSESFHHLSLRPILVFSALLSLFIFIKSNRRLCKFAFLLVSILAIVTFVPLKFLSQFQPYRFQIAFDLWLFFFTLVAINAGKIKYRWLPHFVVTSGVIVSIILLLSFYVSPLRVTLHNSRILNTEIDDSLVKTVNYFNNNAIDGKIIFEVEHSSDAIFFQANTNQKLISGSYRYAFWGNSETHFTEETVFNEPIENVSDAKWTTMTNKYNIQYAVCYSQHTCSNLDGKKSIWIKRADFGGRKIYELNHS